MSTEVLLALHLACMTSQQLTLRPVALDQAVDQEVVVRDDDDTTPELGQALRKRLASFGIQMVGGLVEEEDVRRPQGQYGQLQTSLLAATEAAHGHSHSEVAVETETAQHAPRHLGEALLCGSGRGGGLRPATLGGPLRRPGLGLETGVQLVSAHLDQVLHCRELARAVDLVHLLAVVADLDVIRVVHRTAAGLQLARAQSEERRLA
mmetsp:Transcript_30227/g.100076  ORF Transcript_30227/g.100076 Transcript_30227/m.100076 type:complete len:207 (-) Transcript_30227:1216-1836(-)